MISNYNYKIKLSSFAYFGNDITISPNQSLDLRCDIYIDAPNTDIDNAGVISYDISFTPPIVLNAFYPLMNQADGKVHLNIGITNVSASNETFTIVSANKDIESEYHKYISGYAILFYK